MTSRYPDGDPIVIAAAVLIYALVLSRARLPEISDAHHHGEEGGVKVDLKSQGGPAFAEAHMGETARAQAANPSSGR